MLGPFSLTGLYNATVQGETKCQKNLWQPFFSLVTVLCYILHDPILSVLKRQPALLCWNATFCLASMPATMALCFWVVSEQNNLRRLWGIFSKLWLNDELIELIRGHITKVKVTAASRGKQFWTWRQLKSKPLTIGFHQYTLRSRSLWLEILCAQYLNNAFRHFYQIWHKSTFGLKD